MVKENGKPATDILHLAQLQGKCRQITNTDTYVDKQIDNRQINAYRHKGTDK